ncbi:MAG: hypothetical protein R3227_16210 [Reinekea sp.]|nr:hypothetical protein [Reinekea sp.]
MTQPKLDNRPAGASATLLNANMRLLAPKLVTYDCELSALIECIEADAECARVLIRYANKRKDDVETRIETVNHAIVFLGLIDSKQFLFTYLLLDTSQPTRAQIVQLLVRAKLCSDLFKTNGPVNKDLAFIAALTTHKRFLKIQKSETISLLFKLPLERKEAIKNFDYGLRNTIKQAMIIDTKCNPNSPKREPMPGEFEAMFRDALYWANTIISALS